jgi:hypothetical protein
MVNGDLLRNLTVLSSRDRIAESSKEAVGIAINVGIDGHCDYLTELVRVKAPRILCSGRRIVNVRVTRRTPNRSSFCGTGTSKNVHGRWS